MPALIQSALLVAAGLLLIVIARLAARRRGTWWESFVALRTGDVLITEVIGAFLIGYAIGNLVVSPDRTGPPVPRPGPRGPLGLGPQLVSGLGAAAIAVLRHVDLQNLFWSGRTTRNAVTSYIGWDARVIARIPQGGYGEIALRDGLGNVMAVAATADTDIAEGTHVRVVATRDLNLVVAAVDA